MGLGKTVDLIAFLLHEREHKEEHEGETGQEKEECRAKAPFQPALLICPMSVAGNWQKELERFAPGLQVVVHHGQNRRTGPGFLQEAMEKDVVITTYALAQRDEEHLSAVSWSHVILDEAQNIKNQAARQTQSIKRLSSGQKIALTGTPVENRLSELWSIMDFLNPGYLGSFQSFRKNFVLPIEKYKNKSSSEALRSIIQPFVLRRLKTDPTVIKDLPEKMEMRVNYSLTAEQASLYAAVVEEMLSRIESLDGMERRGQILAALTKLKQKTSPKAVKNGLKAKSKRGSIGDTWWSKRFVGVLESFDMGARLSWGKSYARKGQVISIDVEPGIVRARVQGSFPEPYDVSIKLLPLSPQEWEKAIAAIASKAIFSARLLSGEMPQTIEEAFSDCGISLFPKKKADLKTNCSCPDWSNPCKHIAAVYYLLAEQFDHDPFLIFKLRGKSKEEIVEALRSSRSAGAGEESENPCVSIPVSVIEDKTRPLEESLGCFWQKGSELDLLEINPKSPPVENAVLKILGKSPILIGRANLASFLIKAYVIAASAALQKSARGSEDP